MKFKISQIFNVASQNLLPHDVCLPQICQTCAKIFAKSIPVRTYCAPCSWDCSVPVPPIKPHHYDILTILTRLLLCRCNCEEGFTGKNCETTYVPCDPSPCQNGGQCNPFGPYNYTCQCPTGMYPVPYNGGTLNVMKTVAGTWSSYPPLAELRKFHISF